MLRHERKKKGHLLRVLTVCTLALTLWSFAAAGAFAYTTDSYDIDVVVNEDNSYMFVETIKVNYDSPRHGIYRYIPMTDMDGNTALKVDSMWVDDWDYETYEEDSCKVFKIGSGDVTVTGPQTFRFGYRIRMYDDMDTSGDLLYVDLLPTDWETAIKASTITVKLPKPVDEESIELYASGYGSSETVDNVFWSYDEDSNSVTIEGRRLEKGIGITMLINLPEGYWVGQMNREWMKPAVMGILIGAALLLGILWLLFGRDKKIIPTVEFYPPEGLTPAEVGFIIDGTVDKKDLVSLIIYYADKGYLSIDQYDKKKFRLTKLKDIDPEEKLFARTLFNGLFKTGDTVGLDELGEEFGDAYLSSYESLTGLYSKKKNRQITLKSQVLSVLGIVITAMAAVLTAAFAAEYNQDGGVLSFIGIFFPAILAAIFTIILLVMDSKKYVGGKTGKLVGSAVMWLIDGAVLVLGGICAGRSFENSLTGLMFTVCIIAAQLFTVNMMQRTPHSIELMGKILGLKNFIQTAELDRINALVEENPSYYYDVLPYAFVMGLTDKWAKNFENITIQSPDWYNSYDMSDRMFDAWMFSHVMNNFGSAVSSNVHIPINTDGSGDFGGGGFSGGGFGGGGGGSW